jgi:hypothetical protein
VSLMWSSRVAAVMLATATLACDQASANRTADLAASPARRLVGVWEVAFHVDRPLQLASPPRLRDVRGTVALIENRVSGATFPELPTALHYGVFDVDFAAIGFDPRDRGRVPTAVGRAASDSVNIVLAPGSDRMSVLMRGRFHGDSVTGVWSVTTRVLGGGGRFIMRRLR